MSMGGGNKTSSINSQRENDAKQIAEKTLAYQRENDANNRRLAQEAARAAIDRERTYAADYTRNFGTLSDTYLKSTESALSQYGDAANPIYSQLSQDIKDYGKRSDGIATRSAQEATDYMLANEGNFSRFAEALTMSAFNTRQKLIADVNPFQIAQQQQAGRNNLDMLSGRMPADVMAATQRNSAYAALQNGFGASSSMGQANQARNLGLTSLDLMARADESAQNWAKSIFDTQINGLQVTSGQVADALGVKASDVMNINQANNVGLLGAQSSLASSKLAGLNTALSTRNAAYTNIFSGGLDMNARQYSGATGTSDNSANLLGAQYRTSATVMGAALQDYGNQRQAINSTAWQNQLQEVRDSNAGWGSLITGLTTAAGAVAGSFIPGAGTLVGASLGASLGGALGGAAAGGMGFGSSGGGASYAPVQSNASTNSANSLWNTVSGMFNTGQQINGVNTFSNQNALNAATSKGGYSSSSWTPSMGGWVPQPLTTGRTWTGSGFKTTGT
jgi:hypothetical protein